jgi:hypothetical protein
MTDVVGVFDRVAVLYLQGSMASLMEVGVRGAVENPRIIAEGKEEHTRRIVAGIKANKAKSTLCDRRLVPSSWLLFLLTFRVAVLDCRTRMARPRTQENGGVRWEGIRVINGHLTGYDHDHYVVDRWTTTHSGCNGLNMLYRRACRTGASLTLAGANSRIYFSSSDGRGTLQLLQSWPSCPSVPTPI